MTRRVVWLVLAAVAAASGAVILVALAFVPAAQQGPFLVTVTLATTAMLMLAAFAARLVGESLARPFRGLAAAVARDGPLLAANVSSGALTAHATPEALALQAALRRTQAYLRQTMEQLERDRAQMATIFLHMDDGLLVLDADGRIQLSNPAAHALLRQRALAGRRLPEVAHDPDLVQVARAAASAAQPVAQMVELRTTTEEPRRWLQVIATRLPDGVSTLVLLQDVTAVRHAEAARRDFVANISHELRTPIATVKALAETLEDGALEEPEVAADFVRRMHVEVDGMAQLVSELLELARVEAGQLSLDLRPVSANELVRDAVERLRPYAERVGLHVVLAEPSTDRLRVHADPQRIGQVLANLLGNAVKFTPPDGRIEVGVRATNNALVEFWVADTGIGIDPENLTRVFERFYKTDPSRAGGGTGLGLAISKHLVLAHGGAIWAESGGERRGATFRFTLRRADARENGAASPSRQADAIPLPG